MTLRVKIDNLPSWLPISSGYDTRPAPNLRQTQALTLQNSAESTACGTDRRRNHVLSNTAPKPRRL